VKDYPRITPISLRTIFAGLFRPLQTPANAGTSPLDTLSDTGILL
jgi:hypothetical protein